ncbi:MAG: prepilin peptidase [Parcubacteria group bacterium]|nr:prepilin peptidase [Parcubacteria group bacterium]
MILLSSFVFGLVFGSFLNVVIYRLKSGRNIVFDRSFCSDCLTQLKWHDLVPILSFIWLLGRCRYCKKKISWQYPVVEILSGLIWVGVFYQNFNNLQLFNIFYQIFTFSIFLVIAVYDFKWKIIPDKIVYPAIIIVFLYNIFNSVNVGNVNVGNRVSNIFKYINIEIFIYPLLTAIIVFLFFFAIYYFSSGRAMGLGDAKLAFLIGLFFSPVSTVAALIAAFVIGAVFGIILLALGAIFPRYKKWGMKSQIAFGPFLVIGATIAFFFSNFIYKFINF